VDTLTPIERSRRMSLVRGKNTKPELIVRGIAHRLGYRFRLHRRDLPGTPDLVFPRLRKIILVHGCFWHMHACAGGCRMPKSRAEFWRNKLECNAARDRHAVAALRRSGWRVLTVWQCQMKDRERLVKRIVGFLRA